MRTTDISPDNNAAGAVPAAELERSESAEALDPNSHKLDSGSATGDDAHAPDARRSALPHDDFTPAAPVAAPSEEPAMSDNDALTLDAIRSAINDAVQPLTERLVALETEPAERAAPPPAAAPAAVPTIDERVNAAESIADKAMERAMAAEAALVLANRRPMRQGRSVVPSFGTGPAAVTGYEGIVAECRSVAPTLAAIAERCVATVSETEGAGKVTRRQCEANLSALLVAAEQDGIITDPNHRAVWQ